MPWKLTKIKYQVKPQEIAVKQLLEEMAEYTYAYDSASFETAFKERIKDVPRSNNFSAEAMYKISWRNRESVEVWKLKANGDFNYKMFQLDYLKS